MTGNIDPTRDQFDAFKALPRDEPIQMLNLIRLNGRATYADGTETTGAEAYKAYGRDSGPVFARLGGKIIWRGRPDAMVIGPKDEAWDIAFIAEYPSSAAFMAMVTDEDYKKAVKHRQAAVADSRLVRMKPLGGGDAFG